MKVRRRKWLIPVLVGIPLILVGAFLVALKSVTPKIQPLAVVSREIPDSWLEDDRPKDDEVADVSTSTPAAIPEEPRILEGTLTVVGRGKPFAEEAYALQISQPEANLTSTGRFWFKVVLATVNIPFSQTLEADAALRPTTYTARFDAPLGFGQTIDGVILADHAEVDRGNGLETILVSQEDAFVMGTFSSYAMLPILHARRQVDGVASFEVLVLGGPPQGAGGETESSESANTLPLLRMERIEDAALRAGDLELTVDQYLVTGHLGESRIFSRGGDFLGMMAGEDGEGLLVYRSDYFPDGIELME